MVYLEEIEGVYQSNIGTSRDKSLVISHNSPAAGGANYRVTMII